MIQWIQSSTTNPPQVDLLDLDWEAPAVAAAPDQGGDGMSGWKRTKKPWQRRDFPIKYGDIYIYI